MPPSTMIRTRRDSRSTPARQAFQSLRSHLLAIVLTVIGSLSLATPVSGQDVEVQAETVGLGGRFRPGDFTPMRLQLRSNLSDPTTVWVQWEIPNVDGDIAEYGRAVTLTPGVPTPLWLYAPLPPTTRSTTIWPVRVYELEDGERTRELGGARISAQAANSNETEIDVGRIGIIGSTVEIGLRGYPYSSGTSSQNPLNVGERTQFSAGLSLTDIPDRWEGLSTLEALVWVDLPPQELNQSATIAIREYIRRGGHLILILPQTGDPWSLGTPGKIPFELEQLLPQTKPRTDVDVPLADILPVMCKALRAQTLSGAPYSFDQNIQVFKDLDGSFDGIDNFYEPLITLPDGRVVVIRRTVGHGLITIIGLDIASQRLSTVPLSNGSNGIPQADVFWNPILGRRSDSPTSAELNVIERENRLYSQPPQVNSLGSGGLFADQIRMSSAATIGLLFAFFLFVAYLTIAGPGGFVVLRMTNRVHHSWMLFVVSAFLFSAIAWGIVKVSRDNDVRVKHLTVLDHIYTSTDRGESDPQQQRAISWMSLQTPGYRSRAVTIDNEQGQRDLLSTWIPPGTTTQPFPDVTRYRVDVGSEPAQFDQYADDGSIDSFKRPSRATATSLYANWLGGVDPDWGTFMQPVGPNPVTVVRDQDGNELSLIGQLQHDLPGTLENVSIIWVRNQRPTARRYQIESKREQPWISSSTTGSMNSLGFMWMLSGRWDPGTPLDLAQTSTAPTGGVNTRLQGAFRERFYTRYVARLADIGVTNTVSSSDQREFMRILSYYHQMQPPTYLRGPNGPQDRTLAFQRLMGRELDLSPWLSRPCIIVMGFMTGAESPIPLRVDGEAPMTDPGSTTIVRWIYPLPIDDVQTIRHPLVEPDDTPE